MPAASASTVVLARAAQSAPDATPASVVRTQAYGMPLVAGGSIGCILGTIVLAHGCVVPGDHGFQTVFGAILLLGGGAAFVVGRAIS
jgi:hypothetical protein